MDFEQYIREALGLAPSQPSAAAQPMPQNPQTITPFPGANMVDPNGEGVDSLRSIQPMSPDAEVPPWSREYNPIPPDQEFEWLMNPFYRNENQIQQNQRGWQNPVRS